MQTADLLELRDDLKRETRRLQQLVEGLVALEYRGQRRRNHGSDSVAFAQLLQRCGADVPAGEPGGE